MDDKLNTAYATVSRAKAIAEEVVAESGGGGGAKGSISTYTQIIVGSDIAPEYISVLNVDPDEENPFVCTFLSQKFVEEKVLPFIKSIYGDQPAADLSFAVNLFGSEMAQVEYISDSGEWDVHGNLIEIRLNDTVDTFPLMALITETDGPNADYLNYYIQLFAVSDFKNSFSPNQPE